MAVPPIGGVAAAVPAVSVAAAVDAADADGAVVAPVADAGDVAVGLADRVEKMRAELDMPRSTVSDNLAGGPKTRWQELQQTLRLLATMLLVIEHMDGFWLKFLNDAEWYKITSTAQLEEIFAGKPRAREDAAARNLAPVIEGFGRDDRDTLLLILTDGERRLRADVVELYNKVVDPIFGCDITDDYAAECREAKRVGNALSPFQWLAKMLLVKYDKYDALDERKLDGRRRACCALS
ncbi:hypothetical protein JL722_11154 [Aureococcus anophagefferens]|nr:hypothetical protein JL722_11154 [Aureococcus anophagefferens]